MTVTPIFADMLELFWPAARPLLAPAIQMYRNMYTEFGVHQYLAAGKWQLWMMNDSQRFVAAATSTIETYEWTGWRTLNINLVGGEEMDSWAELFLEAAEDFAKKYNCQSLTGGGRAGWARYLKPHGFQPVLMAYEKVLNYGVH